MAWISRIEEILNGISRELELPKKGLFLKANTDRSGNKTISYSVCIFEPDYPVKNDNQTPVKNAVVMKIKEKAGFLEIAISSVQASDISIPSDAKIKRAASSLFTYISIEADSIYLAGFIRDNCNYALAHYKPKAGKFACCSRFIECSDAGKCVHENKIYSKACQYRINLEAGRIFFGKNRDKITEDKI